jgi:hypothetical protein
MGFLDRLLRKRIPPSQVVALTSIDIFGHSINVVRGLIADNSLTESLGNDPQSFNPTAWNLVIELNVFTLHLADRIAFGVLGAARRAKFMDILVLEASGIGDSILTDKSERAQSDFRESFLALYNAQSGVYGKLPLAPHGQAPFKGTLFWEAAKLAAAEHFSEREAASATLFLSLAFGSCVDALQQLKGRLEQMSEV